MDIEQINKIYIIKENYGRLGNNIFQLICCLYIFSLELNQNKILDLSNTNSKFNLFLFDFNNIELIVNNNQNNNQNNNHIILENFFQDHIDCPSFSIVSDIVDKYLKPSIKWNYLKYKSNSPIIDWTQTLLIHFRSGDIFHPNSIGLSHPYYSQPPWGFYLKIFEDYYHQFPIFLLMAEDKANPLIDKILQLNETNYWKNRNVKFIYYSNNLQTDIRTFLDSPQLVISNSTFSYSLMTLKPNLKNSLIIGCYQTTFLLNECPYILYYDLIDEYPSFNQWKYTLEQKNLMMNYSIDKVRIKNK